MTSSIIAHLHFGGADLSFRKKFRLFFTVAVVVRALGCVKVAVHYYGLEILEVNSLLTSGIGGAIFIIGFLLSSVLADYKEAERIPACPLCSAFGSADCSGARPGRACCKGTTAISVCHSVVRRGPPARRVRAGPARISTLQPRRLLRSARFARPCAWRSRCGDRTPPAVSELLRL